MFSLLHETFVLSELVIALSSITLLQQRRYIVFIVAGTTGNYYISGGAPALGGATYSLVPLAVSP